VVPVVQEGGIRIGPIAGAGNEVVEEPRTEESHTVGHHMVVGVIRIAEEEHRTVPAEARRIVADLRIVAEKQSSADHGLRIVTWI
jgi:hypothetical protein